MRVSGHLSLIVVLLSAAACGSDPSTTGSSGAAGSGTTTSGGSSGASGSATTGGAGAGGSSAGSGGSSAGSGGSGGSAAGSGGSGGSAAGSGGSGGSAAGSGGSAAGSGGSGGTGGLVGAIPGCYHTCATQADCAQGSALTDADNWSCEAGLCLYQGCTADSECQAVYGGPGWTCVLPQGATLKACAKTCATVADCTSLAPIVDADNWACDAGACDYKGCLSDAECQDTYKSPNFVCGKDGGGLLKSCLRTCSAPADCAASGSLNDADNYKCKAGVCSYLGCNTDAECQTAFNSAEYKCN